MSALTASVQDQTRPGKLTVSFRLLLSLYLIIPLCLALQLLDTGLWQSYLKTHLPSSPNHFLLFQILFGTPHIIASAVLLVSNGDYWQHYQRKIVLMTIALAAFFGIGSLFIPYKAFYILVATWTVLHVLKQQHGVARGVCRLPAWAYHLLLGLSVTAGIFIYIGIFLKNSLDVQQTEWLQHLIAGLCVGLIGSALLCQRYVKTTFGKGFLWANVLLILSSFYLYAQQYYFLAILVPRLVHDVTAYIFYVTHDYNKHHQQPQNALYRLSKACQLPIVVVLPALSFALAFVLQAYGDFWISQLTEFFFGVEIRKVITIGLIGYLGLMHYYTESFTWKQDSPYRQFIGFS
ncbi:hypothetical protein [Methylovulum psychrotolerans]|uniref:Uncharacterized protein n=1 Tax=Methylovulum psychrotolerans TaxID=1704499 RepID=A0A2S5CJF5_9GAMM|nr:hypothetical protein [Methylovulum psychrotolerans]MBT9099119.1 hypothetical protein [Methylovulum psychrotolerans]POZ50872.1 hypothetical protein AADEFJLK_03344 [Methylovulum psychrotolerans]